MNELTTDLVSLSQEFDSLLPKLDLNTKRQQLLKLEAQTLEPGFWQLEQAKQVMQELASIKQELEAVEEFQSNLKSVIELTELTNSTPSPEQDELYLEFHRLQKLFRAIKLQACLSGPYDNNGAFLSIHSGQGGTEAMDWASMLVRMYQRFFERKDYNFELIEQSLGEEAGVKSTTFMVTSPYAYGHLKSEAGTHRLVRLSPFNADNLRQTSFAGVEVTPILEEKTATSIKPEELEWQFFRSGGKGGQNVNKVNTAVRVKHLPSGLTVASSTQRYQEQNRKIALQMLEAKLAQLQAEADLAKNQSIKGEHKLAAWGNQIRNYVLHPYQLVKDTRTSAQSNDTTAVLDGDIEIFIEAFLTST